MSTKRWILMGAAIGAFSISTLFTTNNALAAKKPKTVDEVQQALKEQYPDAKFEKTGTRDMNGVQVEQYRITTKDGESTAEITQYGDFVLWGKPRGYGGGNAISQPAEDTLKGLFKGDIKDVNVYQATFYAVDLQTSGSGKNNAFRLRFDPVGRLRAVERITGENREPGFQAGMDKASGGDAKKAEDYAKKYVKDASVENVYSAPGENGFYLVDMKDKDGSDEKITVNSTGRILSQIEQLNKEDLPQPVAQAIDRFFNGERIQKVYRENAEFYQLEETAAAGGAVTIRIRPDGEVMSVSNPQAAEEEKAITASHKESSKSNKNKNR